MADENIKVAVRVRPFNARETGRNSVNIIEMHGQSTLIKDPENMSAEPRKFTFDFSYWSHDGFKEMPDGYLAPAEAKYSDQKKVFADLGEGVLANAWKGYNCSLFAYGQTGSGKSYSMVGYGANKGIVPITCEELFKGIDAKKAEKSKKEYQVTVSMLEIYNEQVRDLLNPSTLKLKGGLKVRQHPKLGFYVDQLTSRPVGSYKDIDAQIESGTKSRTVASTNMNATSSRAHTIVAINFSQKGANEAGQNTTMTSIINLVDLAGSERAESTGATGDRLKEGSAINKSLSSLGNVIKALADQSMGKKSVIVPFRDSTLTRLLKNALGGNSKTIMIAALSPADINYDETVSTLRFADRAKAIKTKAVVNESPTEKLIRELREENERLMNAIKSGGISLDQQQQQQQQQQQAGVSEEEVEEIKKEMEDRLKQNQLEMEEMKKSWQQRLQEQEADSIAQVNAAKDEQEKRKTTAHFWNLNEDTQLTNMVVHFIPKGSSKVGNQKAQPAPDIVLKGLSIQAEHASINHKDNKIKIKAGPGAKVVVNGVQLVDETTLNHNDRVMFGSNHLYVLHHPRDPEILKKKKEAKKKGEKTPEEPPTYEKAQEEIAKNSGFYGGLQDNGKSSSKDDLILQEDLLKILPMINEANAMSEELNRKVAFEPVLVSPQARGVKEGRTEVRVKMKNLTNDNDWLWDRNKFINRKYIMQEMYQNYTDGDDWEVEKEKDPFWEPADADVMIGNVHVYLSSLGYKIELEENLAIADYKGSELGHLKVEIEPCGQVGSILDDDDFLEDPHQMIGGSLNFKVRIPSARGLPQKFSKGETYCKYKVYLDKEYSTTGKVKRTINPDYNHEKMCSFSPVTTQFLDYIMYQPLVVEVWGKQSDAENKSEDKNNKNRETMSTKQLMNADSVSKANIISQSARGEDDDKYRLASELNSTKKRNDKLNSRMARLRALISKAKADQRTSLSLSEVDEIVNGSDSKDLLRFKAAANVVRITEKAKKNGEGKITSSACTLQ